MIFAPIIISLLSLSLVCYIAYYAFIQKPNRLTQLTEAIKKEEGVKAQLIEEINHYSKEEYQIKKTLAELNAELVDMKRKIDELANQVHQSKKDISEAFNLKKNILTDVQKLQSETATINDTHISLKKQIAPLTIEIQSLEKQKNDFIAQVKEYQDEFVRVKKKVNELRTMRTSLESQNSELSEMLEVKKNSTTVETYSVIEEKTNQGKVVNYVPIDKFKKNCYPYVLMPKENCRIQYPRKVAKHILPTGYKDESFATELTRQFVSTNTNFFTDRILVASSKKSYEPDIAAIDEKSGINLFIDIEIDEPYEGAGRFPTHCIGDDDWRNNFFNERGWIVIRFSEKQVHESPLECCRLIAEVIKSVNPSYTIPIILSNVDIVNDEPFWDKLQAEKWQQQSYREQYLNHKFTSINDTSKQIIQDLDLTNEEKEIALTFPIKQKIILETGRWWNIANQHARDSRIEFDFKKHEYYIDGIKDHISATTLIKRFFKEFDADTMSKIIEQRRGIPHQITRQEWEDEKNQAALEGTLLHEAIENFFETRTIAQSKEFSYFLDYYRTTLISQKPYRTEWRIFDNNSKVAGTADLIVRKEDGTFAIYDWKRSKQIKMNGHPDFYTQITQKGIGQLKEVEDCNYIHYCLQLNIYKRILEKYYIAKPVTEMYFIQLHPTQEQANVFKVPDMQYLVDLMFSSTLYRN